MNFIERVMRVMTHINMGAALGLAAWVLWSGWQVVTGQITPAYRVAEVKALMTIANAGEPCRRRSKSEPPYRPNFEPGVEADGETVGCG